MLRPIWGVVRALSLPVRRATVPSGRSERHTDMPTSMAMGSLTARVIHSPA
jgi:hypothetical protein